MHRRIAFSALLLFLLSGRVALAEGAVSGRVSAPEGTKLADIKIVLNPEKARSGRLTVHPSKKGEFFFGIVPQGTWTLTVEGTDLAPNAIKVLVYDNEKRKEVLNYQGPPPNPPQVFDVGLSLKVTYDLTLGPPVKAAPAPGAPSPTDEMPARTISAM